MGMTKLKEANRVIEKLMNAFDCEQLASETSAIGIGRDYLKTIPDDFDEWLEKYAEGGIHLKGLSPKKYGRAIWCEMNKQIEGDLTSNQITLMDLAKQPKINKEFIKEFIENNNNPLFRAVIDNFPKDFDKVKVGEGAWSADLKTYRRPSALIHRDKHNQIVEQLQKKNRELVGSLTITRNHIEELKEKLDNKKPNCMYCNDYKLINNVDGSKSLCSVCTVSPPVMPEN